MLFFGYCIRFILINLMKVSASRMRQNLWSVLGFFWCRRSKPQLCHSYWCPPGSQSNHNGLRLYAHFRSLPCRELGMRWQSCFIPLLSCFVRGSQELRRNLEQIGTFGRWSHLKGSHGDCCQLKLPLKGSLVTQRWNQPTSHAFWDPRQDEGHY